MKKNKRIRRPFDPMPGMVAMLQARMGKLFEEERPKQYTQEEIDAWKQRMVRRSGKRNEQTLERDQSQSAQQENPSNG